MKVLIKKFVFELQKTAPIFLIMVFVCIEVGRQKSATPDYDSMFMFVEGIVGGWILVSLIGLLSKK